MAAAKKLRGFCSSRRSFSAARQSPRCRTSGTKAKKKQTTIRFKVTEWFTRFMFCCHKYKVLQEMAISIQVSEQVKGNDGHARLLCAARKLAGFRATCTTAVSVLLGQRGELS